MPNRLLRTASVVAALLLFSCGFAPAQTPPPENLAAARELVGAINLADQFKTMLPIMMKALKPAIVQGRSDVDRDFDAMTPILLGGFQARVSEVVDAIAIIYSSNFSADDLRALTAFYRTPTGRKFLQKQPVVMQESVVAGQKFGQSVAAELRGRIVEELRKKGYDL